MGSSGHWLSATAPVSAVKSPMMLTVTFAVSTPALTPAKSPPALVSEAKSHPLAHTVLLPENGVTIT